MGPKERKGRSVAIIYSDSFKTKCFEMVWWCHQGHQRIGDWYIFVSIDISGSFPISQQKQDQIFFPRKFFSQKSVKRLIECRVYQCIDLLWALQAALLCTGQVLYSRVHFQDEGKEHMAVENPACFRRCQAVQLSSPMWFLQDPESWDSNQKLNLA